MRATASGDPKLIIEFYFFVKTAPNLSCYWCKIRVPIKRRHVDHITPVSKGGAHVLANLCCACSTCNQRKGAKMPIDFAGQGELCMS